MSVENNSFYKKEVSSSLLSGIVTNGGNRLNLNLTYLSELSDKERFQNLPLPRFFSSFQELSERKLSINWIEGLSSKETFSRLLEGLSTYISLKYPGFWIITPIKNHAEKAHGQSEESTYQFIPVVHFLNEITENTMQQIKIDKDKWTGSFSNVVIIAPEPHSNFKVDEIPIFPQNEGIPQMLIFPVVDLDINASGNPQKDLEETGRILLKNGFSGWLIQSGDSPNGGYHYLADFMMPYNPFMWQSLGKIMYILTPQENDDLIKLSKYIETATNLKQAKNTASDILKLDQLRKRTFPFSYVDFRYCAHQIEVGMSKLRALTAKNYSKPPTIVAEIL